MARPRSDRQVPPDNVLIVEGKDDQHVMWGLFESRQIPEKFAVELGGTSDSTRTGREEGGYERLRENVRERLRFQNHKRIGIVVDADSDVAARWQSLRDLLLESGYTAVPLVPEPRGTIIGPVAAAGVERTVVGIWLMPDNTLPGALEEFVRLLVPPEKIPLWDHAEACVAYLPMKPAPLTDNWLAKARIHSYLAWHDEPGTPMGQAITKRYLAGNAEAARPFMDWLRRLFDLDSAS